MINWLLFITLCIIWGSSFIIMKEGMLALQASQVAAIRILSGGIVLLPVAVTRRRQIPSNKFGVILLSGLLGSFIPAFLFCIAETKIDSSLAGFLNALTPIFTILIGVFFFKSQLQKKKIPGVLLGFAGMLLLFLAGGTTELKHGWYALLVIIATISYASNVNMVGRYLKEITSTNIASFAFAMLIIPSLIVLYVTGFFDFPVNNPHVLYSTAMSAVLGIMGTAVASILFYVLLRRAGPLFSSMVTYGIPFIALFWGLLAGETVLPLQLVGLGIILIGVYLTSK
ncbi:MAG TPA: DMT family transporter [Flavitalea sp.]|nr:DMT family transporter [Flavitalea sp.]